MFLIIRYQLKHIQFVLNLFVNCNQSVAQNLRFANYSYT